VGMIVLYRNTKDATKESAKAPGFHPEPHPVDGNLTCHTCCEVQDNIAGITTTVLISDIWKHFKPLHLTKNMRVERLLQHDKTTQERIVDLKFYL